MKKNIESKNNGGNGAMMRILPLILYLYNHDIPKYKNLDEDKNKAGKEETDCETCTSQTKMDGRPCSREHLAQLHHSGRLWGTSSF